MVYKYPICDVFHWFCKTARFFATEPPFVYKRRSFEHEHEIRAMVLVHNGEKNEKTSGIYVSVSLNTLIEKIYVSPKAPKWFLDLVKSVSKKYGLDKEVIQSNLYNGLVY